MRILVAGGPRTGKTTLAAELSRLLVLPVRHTDDLFATRADWATSSKAIAAWMDEPGIIEGVAAVYGLREWLRAHDSGKPCGVLFWSTTPKVTLSAGQRAMTKACKTVFSSLDLRGLVPVEF